ncbi:MAG: galactokinase [Verrucomicrobiae bacterium]|nr:galactokinase [Verrucomicrobiae bacterium]
MEPPTSTAPFTNTALPAPLMERLTAALGREPVWIVSAPGRVNLIGEHVDYCDGFVLPMAVERRCVIAAVPATGDVGRIRTLTLNETTEIELASKPAAGRGWENYVRGVISGFQERGARLPGFDAVIFSDVPLGCGLSSSASIEVAIATLIEAMTGTIIDPLEKAELCQRAEHEYAGVPCGLMDQYASVMARRNHLLLLDCRTKQSRQVPFADPGLLVLIINTNVKRKLVDGEYAKRRAQCESAAKAMGLASLRDATLEILEGARGAMDESSFRRGRHAITEISRTSAAADAIAAGDWAGTGRLMYASHDSLRDDFEVSCAELDVVVDIAGRIGEAGGVYGCRMTGAGFGGAAVALVRASAGRTVEETIRRSYREQTGLEPYLFASRPAHGAMILRRPD